MTKIRIVAANYGIAFVLGITFAAANIYFSTTTCQNNLVPRSLIAWILGIFLFMSNLPAVLLGSGVGIETELSAIFSALTGFMLGRFIHRYIKDEPDRLLFGIILAANALICGSVNVLFSCISN